MNTVEVNEKDYSRVVELIKSDDQRNLRYQIENLINHISASLMRKVRGYTYKQIKDIVIAEYYTIHEKIVSGKIKDDKAILSYYYRTCLHKIYNVEDYNKRFLYLDDADTNLYQKIFIEPQGIEEDYDYFYYCINKLRKEYRDIVKLYLKHPSIQSKDVGRELGMTDGTVRLYKHRALKQLKRDLSKERINLPKNDMDINTDKEKQKPRTLVNVISDLNTLKDNYKRGNINEEAYKLKLKLLEEEVNIHIDEMSELQIG